MRKYVYLLTLMGLLWIPNVSAADLTRAHVTAFVVGPVSLRNVTLREVLQEVKRLAANKGIVVHVQENVLTLADSQRLTLHVDDMTLDGLLEFVTRTTGTEWDIVHNQVVVYTDEKLVRDYQERLKSPARRQLDRVIIHEIEFDNLDWASAFEKVREEATRLAGLGAVPKIDIPIPLNQDGTIDMKVRNASVLTLFNLIMADSVSGVDWDIEGAKITVVNEALRRKKIREQRIRQERMAKARHHPSGYDAFGAGDAFGVGGGGAFVTGTRGSAVEKSLSHGREATLFNTESYDHFGDNPFFAPKDEPLSTFSIDVDTASYANIRRLIRSGRHVPLDATRIEELINSFSYEYAPPANGPAGKPMQGAPFSAHLEVASAPWAPGHRLVRIGLKGYEIDWETRPPSNLVFLLDVSGSMKSEQKLGLVKESLKILVRRLGPQDTVSIVVYAGASGLALPPTAGNQTEKIIQALEELTAGGSTNGGEGIDLAYRIAREHFIKNGNNRIILCTDGDFNVGATDRASLLKQVQREANSGIYLTALGFGTGNLKDGMLETLSNKGNGNYAYIDTLREARKHFVRGLSGTLITIANDVKIQVEFNPAQVGAYRLIGYENRLLDAQDFADDTKDAGDIGAGHTVTALYEIVPRGQEAEVLKRVAPLKYQQITTRAIDPDAADELLTLKIRYKEPRQNHSELLSFSLKDSGTHFDDASTDFRFSAAVASFGMVLRKSDYRGNSTALFAQTLAREALGEDPHNERKAFLELIETYLRQVPKR